MNINYKIWIFVYITVILIQYRMRITVITIIRFLMYIIYNYITKK